MVKELLTFSNIEIDKNIFWGDVDIEKVLVSNKFLLVKTTTNTLLVTCIIKIDLNHSI